MTGLNFDSVLWDRDDDPNGNVQHIARHQLTQDDVEGVLGNPAGTHVSRSTGRPVVFGETRDGKYVMVAYEWVDATTVYPVTAYEVPRPRRTRT